MKIVLSTFLLFSNLLAYQINDEISPVMATHLGVDENRIYIIDFFASWCSSCQKEIPLTSKANLKIDHNKVKIIGVDVDKNTKNGIAFQARFKEEGKLNFRVINDPQNLVISEFNPIGMPTLYYIKNKKIVKIITGAINNVDKQILKDLKGLE